MTRLVRSSFDKMLFGVCGGLAQRFGIDSTIVRVIFVIGAIFGIGSFVLIYIVLAFVMPRG
ncbi:MAG: PspC domain-containing protein [Bacteroidetes bacterium]|nr:PspC domain-containing protein [Bacteroidota bacterium]MCH8524111.1 PspC domain-containing protein [Balneolales bacterium]